MKLIDPVTRVDLHMIALESTADMTPGMIEFIRALPADHNPATGDEIEAFDRLLDEMEGT